MKTYLFIPLLIFSCLTPVQAASPLSEIRLQLYQSINQERSDDVRWKSALNASSKKRVKELPIRNAHIRPNGKRWYTVLRNYKKIYCGENLAKVVVPDTYEISFLAIAIHQSFMHSSSHKKVIMNKRYHFIGISVMMTHVNKTYVIYIVEHFSS